MIPRWPFYASVAVLGCAGIACFLAAAIEWGSQPGVLAGTDSAEAVEQARFTIELGAFGVLNLLALIAYLLRRSGLVWWLVLGLQVGIFVVALIEGVFTDIGWFLFSSLPLLTGLMLLACGAAQRRLKPRMERNLTAF